ncbi:alcohol dehydrogenase catalytic domain-containing protein [Paenibacillus foliorum]|nr:alcohol dehydrogenase catalytic domain-containing protein [Paenibacillus foliorum]
MKAVVNYQSGAGVVKVCDVPAPTELRPKDILIQVKAAGVCGSDLHMYHDIKSLAKVWVLQIS